MSTSSDDKTRLWQALCVIREQGEVSHDLFMRALSAMSAETNDKVLNDPPGCDPPNKDNQ